jgi:Skp family chaperone for outer membrane proteins
MSLKNTLLTFFLFLILGSSLGWAQSGREIKNPHEMAQERIQMIKMYRLTETLKLDREETAKFFAITNQYEENKRKLRRELHDDIQRLRNLMREVHPQDKELREVLARIKTKDKDLRDIKLKQDEEEINLLKPEQQARYILFQIDFRRDMENMIREIREERSRRPGSEPGSEKIR